MGPPHNGVLLSRIKEWTINTDTCDNMNEYLVNILIVVVAIQIYTELNTQVCKSEQGKQEHWAMAASGSLFLWCTNILQNITVGGRQLKGKWDLSVLFLTTAYESTMISIKIFNYRWGNCWGCCLLILPNKSLKNNHPISCCHPFIRERAFSV